MKFFDRRFWHGRPPMQEEYSKVSARYRQYIDANRDRLSASMYEFSQRSLHDEIVERISWVGDRQLELLTDGHRITFSNVRSTDCDWRALDDVLTHEVHPSKDGLAEVIFLLSDRECRIIAENVLVESRVNI